MSQILFTQPDWQLFTNINTLPQQAGVSRHLLPKLVAKELTDNALDTGAKVEIFHENDGMFQDTIIIRDYGAGFPGTNAEIANLFSINRPLTSSKRFRLPLRGALGNGLRVVVATVYCTGGSLFVATRGRRLQLLPQDDGSTAFQELGTFEEEGTEIKVVLPDNFFGEGILDWANLSLEMNRGETFSEQTNPFWYDSDSFYNLLLATPDEVQIADFLVFFEKISPAKAKKIASDLQKKSSFSPLNRIAREEADLLLESLRLQSKPIKAQKLGAVGELESFPAYHKTYSTLALKTTKGKFDAEIPLVIEAYAASDGRGQGQFFVNKTPITGDVDVSYYEKRISLYGCGLSRNIEVAKIPENPSFWVNIITPYMPIVSNGKEPDLLALEDSVTEAIRKVASQLKKHGDPERNPFLFEQDKAPSQKKIVIEHLDTAIDKASGKGQYRYSLRQLYYVMRPLVMENTGKELKYANFNTIITDFEYESGQDLRGVYRDERGTLLHPHTHYETKLGTKNIEQYQRPIFNFNKILYSEKEGFFEILKDARFCEKYDCALLTSKGFASRAARDVIDLLAETEEELYFFCIHDADLSGTLIYQALQGATKARPGRKVHIYNLGLEPWEGLEMGLEVESLEKRSTKNPAQYVMDYDTDLTQNKPFHYLGYERWADWQEWLKSFRIELNAMDTPTFIHWLDDKFSAYPVGKVVPHETYLQQEAENSLESSLKQQIKEEILRNLNIEKLISEKFEGIFPALKAQLEDLPLEENLRKQLQDSPTHSWQQSFLEILGELMRNWEGK
ncbi:MAG: hypothetical protein NW226_01480 [Microscillaceae bacterium]|nr:hypothetical protein [Microscillaceae bacterium]